MLVAPAVLGAGAAGAAVDRAEIERLIRENEALEQRLDLARGDDFYLVLDRADRRLDLMLKGAVLQEYEIETVRVGVPRVAFVSKGLPTDWEGRIWSGGVLDPPRELDRLEFEAPPPDPTRDEADVEPPPLPPTPEEAFPVPDRFHIRFENGLALEIRRSDGPDAGSSGGWLSSLGAAIRAWCADRIAVLRPRPEDSLRLRLVVRGDEADSLYRALPPDTKLLIVPPGS